MGWLRWLIAVWQQRRALAELGEATRDIVEEVVAPSEPSQPLTYKDNEHIRRQVDAATSHRVEGTAIEKVPPPPRLPILAVPVEPEPSRTGKRLLPPRPPTRRGPSK